MSKEEPYDPQDAIFLEENEDNKLKNYPADVNFNEIHDSMDSRDKDTR